ncbi:MULTISPECIES: EhaD family protein [Methanobacterium]|jgi:energy-converting hydrogenase A subunit D|uniref:EhaD family protein n=1 Tax=Methanobacterium subterraneum TaxID=59277 RepID=A0A2H4VEE8_9EURY|nr:MULTISPECIES: EhaD family protein [Methanobacterium]MBW4257349.1 EhaD family protein [Methanobacterium sp. YSL]AUB56473.1 energy-converting hydrogenase A subunit D EhaD [Methanobacterium subterraneum]AUB58657.1 energy-converting hydrogenase A subunit D EhaD [Methanobacterium sp. MZ-A1]AUB59663.1 energy-converting hydrogenase A subunit D EhaD [Methanobacterium subterraneum]MCC7558917.1 EhaD family protein [Methanobacterium sp.]
MYLDFVNLTTISAALALIGTVGIIALPKPLDKVIMFALLQGGFVGMIVAAKYLDVAMAAAIFDPIATIILLIGIIKINEVRKKNQESQEDGNLA